jgi:hypothetical protein
VFTEHVCWLCCFDRTERLTHLHAVQACACINATHAKHIPITASHCAVAVHKLRLLLQDLMQGVLKLLCVLSERLPRLAELSCKNTVYNYTYHSICCDHHC